MYALRSTMYALRSTIYPLLSKHLMQLLFTLGSVCRTSASGAKQTTERNNWTEHVHN